MGENYAKIFVQLFRFFLRTGAWFSDHVDLHLVGWTVWFTAFIRSPETSFQPLAKAIHLMITIFAPGRHWTTLADMLLCTRYPFLCSLSSPICWFQSLQYSMDGRLQAYRICLSHERPNSGLLFAGYNTWSCLVSFYWWRHSLHPDNLFFTQYVFILCDKYGFCGGVGQDNTR